MNDDPGRALEAVLKLTALDERSAELKASLERIERKLEVLVERLATVEARVEQLDRRAAASDLDAVAASLAVEESPLARSFLTVVSEE